MPPVEIETLEERIDGLHALMISNFEYTQEKLADIKSALEKLMLTAVTEQVYQRQIERINEHDKRLGNLETFIRPIKIVGTIAGAIVAAVLIALATGKAHIVWH